MLYRGDWQYSQTLFDEMWSECMLKASTSVKSGGHVQIMVHPCMLYNV